MDNNAGNYIGLRFKYNTPDVAMSGTPRNAFLFNIHWGLQRPIGESWSFYTQAGGGYGFDIESGFSTFYPAVDLKFSYLIVKRKFR